MSAPAFTPDDAKALIPSPTASLCGNFVKALFRLPVLFYQLCKSLMNDDGTFKVTVATGDLIFSAAPSAEDANRLLCNGQEVSKTTYADLYAVVGDIYGTPAVGTNFKLPDFRDRFPLGVSATNALASTGGSTDAQEITLAVTDIPPLQHKLAVEDNNNSQGEAVSPSSGYKYLKVNDGSSLYWAAVPTDSEIYKNAIDSHQAADDQTDVVVPHVRSPWLACYVYIKT